MAKDSNPVLNGIIKKYQRNNNFSGFRNPMEARNPFGYSSRNNDSFSPTSSVGLDATSRAITYDDIISKTGLTLGLIICTTIISYLLCVTTPVLGTLLGFAGMIVSLGAIVMNFFSTRKGKATTPTITWTYALGEGLALGWFTWAVANMGRTASFPWIAAQALFATLGVFVAMLAIYKNRIIRVTPRFNKIMLSSIMGILFMSFGSTIIGMFTGGNILYNGGIISIIFSLVVIVIASLSFLTDFDNAETLVKIGAPQEEAWGLALGFAVGIVWLYTEILRFLGYFSREN